MNTTAFNLFDAYRHDYTNNENEREYCSLDTLLRLWKENKSKYLFPLFNDGENLILEKKIQYTKPRNAIVRELDEMMDEHARFKSLFAIKLHELCGIDYSRYLTEDITYDQYVMHMLIRSLYDIYTLYDNSLDLGYWSFEDNHYDWLNEHAIKKYTLKFNDGSKVQLNSGMKITRAFTQICKHLGMEDEWEEIRLAHSQIFNTNKMTGTLCLSIHPLDYATASDNDNGWSSCMSWKDEGCYRMGTVEMMNSPMVICAYLRSENAFMSIIDDDDWNSKKWRAWIIVTPECIFCNRHYPFHQEELAKECIQWVKDLVQEHYGWSYGDIHEDFNSYRHDKCWDFDIETNYMYNDTHDAEDLIGCLSTDTERFIGDLNFSGPAECMICGAEVKHGELEDSGTLECYNCQKHTFCYICGDVIEDPDEIYYDPDGNPLCYSCFENHCVDCCACGDTVNKEDTIDVNWYFDKSVSEKYLDKINKFLAEYEDEYSNLLNNLDYLKSIIERNCTGLLFNEQVSICSECGRLWGAWYDKDTGKYYINPNASLTLHECDSLFEFFNYRHAKRIIDRNKFHPGYYNDVVAEQAQIFMDFWADSFEAFKQYYYKKHPEEREENAE